MVVERKNSIGGGNATSTGPLAPVSEGTQGGQSGPDATGSSFGTPSRSYHSRRVIAYEKRDAVPGSASRTGTLGVWERAAAGTTGGRPISGSRSRGAGGPGSTPHDYKGSVLSSTRAGASMSKRMSQHVFGDVALSSTAEGRRQQAKHAEQGVASTSRLISRVEANHALSSATRNYFA